MALDRQYYMEATFGGVPYHAALVVSPESRDRRDIRKSLSRAIRHTAENTGHEPKNLRMSVQDGLMTTKGFQYMTRAHWLKEASWLKQS